MYELYRQKYDINYKRNVSNLFGVNTSINIITFKDRILNRDLLTLTLSTEDILSIADLLSSYMSVGGYKCSIVLNSLSNNYLTYILSIYPDYENIGDVIVLEEGNIITKTKVKRLKLIFNNEDETEFGIFEFFIDLYENFLFDIISMKDLYPDYADCY